MKTMSVSRECRASSSSSSSSGSRPGSISPTGRVRKERSEERREKLKVEATLRRLVGSDEGVDQYELLYQIMSYIRELQGQLVDSDKENPVPGQLDALFSDVSTTDKENDVAMSSSVEVSQPALSKAV